MRRAVLPFVLACSILVPLGAADATPPAAEAAPPAQGAPAEAPAPDATARGAADAGPTVAPPAPAGADPGRLPDADRLAANRMANQVYQRKRQALLADLTSPRGDVRRSAITALGALRDQSVAPALKALLLRREAPLGERAAAAQALAAAGDPADALTLREATRSSEPAVRLAAWTALLTLRAATPEDLAHWASDPDPEVNGPGITVLSGSPEPSQADLLAQALRRHPIPTVRAAAAAGLAHLGDAADLTTLTTALSDGRPEVRAAAAQALADLKRVEAVPNLLLSLESGLGGDHAAAAIASIAGSDFGWRAARTRQEQQESLDRGYAWCVDKGK